MKDSQSKQENSGVNEPNRPQPAGSANGPGAGSGPGDKENSVDESRPADPVADVSLREQLEATRAERDANYDLYLRAQAELQNYRKRVQKESDEMRLYQALPLARDLLPAFDNLHRALSVAETSKNVDELLKGVRLVAKQIEDALKRHQVLPIESVGKPFDPNLHQAIQQVPTEEHKPMTVIQEVERGFTLNDRVVRPSTVIVAQAPSNPDNNPSTGVE